MYIYICIYIPHKGVQLYWFNSSQSIMKTPPPLLLCLPFDFAYGSDFSYLTRRASHNFFRDNAVTFRENKIHESGSVHNVEKVLQTKVHIICLNSRPSFFYRTAAVEMGIWWAFWRQETRLVPHIVCPSLKGFIWTTRLNHICVHRNIVPSILLIVTNCAQLYVFKTSFMGICRKRNGREIHILRAFTIILFLASLGNHGKYGSANVMLRFWIMIVIMTLS